MIVQHSPPVRLYLLFTRDVINTRETTPTANQKADQSPRLPASQGI